MGIFIDECVNAIYFIDIDECVEAVSAGRQACMDESMLCANTVGSFMCTCPGNTQFLGGECREPGKHNKEVIA